MTENFIVLSSPHLLKIVPKIPVFSLVKSTVNSSFSQMLHISRYVRFCSLNSEASLDTIMTGSVFCALFPGNAPSAVCFHWNEAADKCWCPAAGALTPDMTVLSQIPDLNPARSQTWIWRGTYSQHLLSHGVEMPFD